METSHLEPELLRATHVFTIRVAAAVFGSWEPAEAALVRRRVDLQVSIESSLKGRIPQGIARPFSLQVWQKQAGGGRIGDFYGVWSHVALETGSRFVAACLGDADDAVSLLQEGSCVRLIGGDSEREDARRVLELEARQPALAEVLSLARERAREGTAVLAGFVVFRFWREAGDQILAAEDEASLPSAFFALLALMIDPTISLSQRIEYLSGIYQELGQIEPAPRAPMLPLIRAMLALLSVPGTEEIHDEILEVYLPNLLDLDQETTTFKASDVFAQHANERHAADSSLMSHRLQQAAQRILTWLRSS